MKAFILFFALFLSSNVFALPQFTLEVGTQSCVRQDGIENCGRTSYAAEGIQLSDEPYQKLFIANELSKPFHFQLILVVRENSNGKGYICRVFLKNPQDGSGLGSYSTNVNSLEELNEIKLGSSQVAVSPTESYYGWVKLTRTPLPQQALAR